MRRRGNLEEQGVAPVDLPRYKPTPLPHQTIPTLDVRHRPYIRFGKQSAEVFAKNKVAKVEESLALASPEQLDQLRGVKDETSQGSRESIQENERDLRKRQESAASPKRQSRSVRKGPDENPKAKQRVSKGSKARTTQKPKPKQH